MRAVSISKQAVAIVLLLWQDMFWASLPVGSRAKTEHAVKEKDQLGAFFLGRCWIAMLGRCQLGSQSLMGQDGAKE